jgi:hypothetical protein
MQEQRVNRSMYHGESKMEIFTKNAGPESKPIDVPWKTKDETMSETCREGGAE